MNRLSRQQRTAILQALVEGNSIRATCRITGTAKGTVLKLLADVGPVCAAFHDNRARNLNIRRVEADEIWSFCHAKGDIVKSCGSVVAGVTRRLPDSAGCPGR